MSRAVVDAARAWIGTPYRHGASVPGAGADCLGLVRGLWRELVGPEPAGIPCYAPDWSDARGDEVLWQAIASNLVPVRACDPAAPGEVLLLRMRLGGIASHLGIRSRLGPHPRMIHALSGHGVRETSLSRPWDRRVVARFRFPMED